MNQIKWGVGYIYRVVMLEFQNMLDILKTKPDVELVGPLNSYSTSAMLELK